MNSKRRILFSIIILFPVLLFLSSFVLAYPYSSGGGLFGGLETDILETLSRILSFEIRLPGWGNVVPTQVIPLWVLIAMFAVLFSIVYPLTINVIPIFKEENAKNSAKAFAIAVSFLVILGTQFPTFFYKYVVGSTGLLIISGIIWLAYVFWEYGLRSPLKRFKPLRTSDELRKLNDERLATNAEKKLYENDERILKSSDDEIKKILQQEGDLLSKIRKVKEYIVSLNEVRNRRGPAAVKDFMNKLKTELSKIVNELKTTSKLDYKLEKDWEKIINDKNNEFKMLESEYETFKKYNFINDPKLEREIKEMNASNKKVFELLKEANFEIKESKNQIQSIIEKMDELIRELGIGDLEKAYKITLELETYILTNQRLIENIKEKENEIKKLEFMLTELIKKLDSTLAEQRKKLPALGPGH